MSQPLRSYVCGFLLIAALLLAGGWNYWDKQTPSNAWIIERPEQIISGVSPEQAVKVTFNLKNTSRQPLRILGSSAC